MLCGMDTQTTLERAFDIAGSGGCISVTELIRRLKDEGYEIHQLEGPHLRRQLTRLMNEKKPSRLREGHSMPRVLPRALETSRFL
jgi:hypothetical protein